MTKWEQLEECLSEAQREQLAELLLAQLGNGWGMVEVKVRDHQIVEYLRGEVTPAVRIAETAIRSTGSTDKATGDRNGLRASLNG